MKLLIMVYICYCIRYNDYINNHKRMVNVMEEKMTEKELITMTIEYYMNLQRIKKDNKGTENKELDYQIRGTVAKLSSLGVNVEDLTL